MPVNFDEIVDRRGTDSIKWNKYPPDVLPFWVADMDFLSPPAVIRELKERVEHGVFGYPEIQEGTKRAVMDWLWKRHRWSVSEDEILLLPGVVVGFNLAAHAFTVPGQGVLVQTPTYRPFLQVAKNVNRAQHSMSLPHSPSGDYHVTRDAFEGNVRENTGVFMLCNPQNPTGRVFTKTELEEMAEICLRHDITICSDEIHHDIVYPESKHIPIASLSPEIAKRTITLISPTKTFNIAGIKGAAAIVQDSSLRDRFLQAKQGLVGWVNLFGQIALRTAYTEGSGWLDELLPYLDQNRQYLQSYVEGHLPGITLVPPQGTYLAWLDCRRTGIDHPQAFFLEEAKVALGQGQWFGADGRGFARLNFGCPRSLLQKGLDRMSRALESI